MDYSEIYRKRIRTLCEERGISINRLATMSGVSQSTLDNIMRGLSKNPNVRTMHKVANAFNMTLGQFIRNYTQTTKRGLLTTNKG